MHCWSAQCARLNVSEVTLRILVRTLHSSRTKRPCVVNDWRTPHWSFQRDDKFKLEKDGKVPQQLRWTNKMEPAACYLLLLSYILDTTFRAVISNPPTQGVLDHKAAVTCFAIYYKSIPDVLDFWWQFTISYDLCPPCRRHLPISISFSGRRAPVWDLQTFLPFHNLRSFEFVLLLVLYLFFWTGLCWLPRRWDARWSKPKKPSRARPSRAQESLFTQIG